MNKIDFFILKDGNLKKTPEEHIFSSSSTASSNLPETSISSESTSSHKTAEIEKAKLCESTFSHKTAESEKAKLCQKRASLDSETIPRKKSCFIQPTLQAFSTESRRTVEESLHDKYVFIYRYCNYPI